MAITLEKIDLIMDRAKVSYIEAREALERNDGNVVDTLIELEEKQKTKKKKKWKRSIDKSFFKPIEQWFSKVNQHKLTVSDGKKEYLSIPLLIAVILIVFTFPISILTMAILIILGYKIAIIKESGEEFDINDVLQGSSKDENNDDSN